MSQLSDFSSRLPISRRAALKLLGIGTISGLVGYSRFVKPQPTVFQQDSLVLPHKITQPKKVVVVGAGLAGLACAYELSQRGFAVTLFEKSSNLGGKVASWPIKFGEEEFIMEHGFHGFFPQYYNLNNLVEELAITDNFKSLEFYSLVFNKEKYDPEVFRPSNSAFPWNIVDLAISSPNRFHWGINLTKVSHLQVFQAITSFKIPKTFNNFDSISVTDWVEKGFPQGLYDLYFLPFAKSSLNAPDVLSAGELLQFFHFYFFGNPEGLAFNGTRHDMGTSLVEPIAKEIIAKGGQIIPEATVSEINWQEGQISSLSYYRGNSQTEVPFWVERNALLGKEYYGAGDDVYLLQGEDKAISLTCTHQGCTVKPQANGEFVCPCHGALYNQEGKVISGPAKRNLASFAVVKQQENQVQLVAANPQLENNKETINADYYVIATNVPGTKHLFQIMTGDIEKETASQVDSLALADSFAVARFWFDEDFDWEHSWFTSLSGYALTDSITLYHRIQEQFITWSEKTGGSVVELHAYCYKEKEFPTQESLLTTFEEELYQIVPKLKNSQMLHRELVNQKNFSGYPPNSYENRPETTTKVPNLAFAGDWVKMPFPCGLMERAVSSGLLAANAILYKEGLQRKKLLTVNPEGVLKI